MAWHEGAGDVYFAAAVGLRIYGGPAGGPTWQTTRHALGRVLLGLMLLSKFSTAPMFALALLWLLLLGPDKIIINLGNGTGAGPAAAMLLALFVLWAGYFFHVSHLAVRDGTLTATFPN